MSLNFWDQSYTLEDLIHSTPKSHASDRVITSSKQNKSRSSETPILIQPVYNGSPLKTSPPKPKTDNRRIIPKQ
ncbi:MAG: hypothetical protein LBU84_13870, partial [Prevotella sp.]|nr:hypothetical protein [Prevotella sp.]